MGSVPVRALGGTVVSAGSLPEGLRRLNGCKASQVATTFRLRHLQIAAQGGNLVKHSGWQA